MMRLNDLAAAALAALLAVAPASAQDLSTRDLSGKDSSAGGNAPDHTITALGRGAVLAAMDTAVLTILVTAEGSFAQDAVEADRAKVKRLASALRDAGVFDGDMSQSALQITPRSAPAEAPIVSPGVVQGFVAAPAQSLPQAPRIPTSKNGFFASTTFRLKTHSLADIGILVDRLAENDDSRVPTIIYVLENSQKVFEEARRQAFDNAEHTARLEAQRAHLRLVSIRSVSDEPLHLTGSEPPASVNFTGQSQAFGVSILVQWNTEPDL